MTDRYTTLGELTMNDVGKSISIGDQHTGIVTGVLRSVFGETQFVYEQALSQAKADEIPVGVLYYVTVSAWESNPLMPDTKVTIED